MYDIIVELLFINDFMHLYEGGKWTDLNDILTYVKP